jgi:hypothetical protein
MNQIRILTNIDANHGSCIFNASLVRLLQNLDPENNVKILDFLNPKWRFTEAMRALKINPGIPFYNFQRLITLSKFTSNQVPVEKRYNLRNYESLASGLNSESNTTYITAKVMWDISKKSSLQFPNIYWLSDKIKSKKIAYATSGHRTDLEVFKQHKKKVREILSSYQLIGVRDNMTQLMMEEARITDVTPVYRISDPAFFYEPKNIDSNELVRRYGISPTRPLLGLLYYGKPEISKRITEYYHQKGYQIINFNMFNPFADINIGHLVTPDEWVALIRQLTFCITDRFHVSVFCLRENIPFTAIEPFQPRTLLNSKIFSILEDFGIEDPCYQDTYSPKFDFSDFISICRQVEHNWENDFSSIIQSNLLRQNNDHRKFLQLVNKIISS